MAADSLSSRSWPVWIAIGLSKLCTVNPDDNAVPIAGRSALPRPVITVETLGKHFDLEGPPLIFEGDVNESIKDRRKAELIQFLDGGSGRELRHFKGYRRP